jgi:hypothetical protein
VGWYTRSILVSVMSALLVSTCSCFIPSYVPFKVIQASEVLEKIKTGQPVEYEHVKIKGNLDLSKLGLPKSYLKLHSDGYQSDSNETFALVSSKVNINDAKIEGNVDFRNTVFTNLMDFENTVFNGTVDVSKSLFLESVYFTSCQFNRQFEGVESLFGEKCDFSDSIFNNIANFWGAYFRNDAKFNSVYFNKTANFWGSYFNGMASFLFSDFISEAEFSNSKFIKDANFGDMGALGVATWNADGSYFGSTNTNFKGDADFSESNFSGKADFSALTFSRYADFSSTYLTQDANFARSGFEGFANFRDAQFLSGADFSMSQFNENTNFEGTKFLKFLDLTEAQFGRINIYWPDITLLICNDGPTYLKLIKNYRDIEQYEIADTIYFQYRSWRQNQRPWSDGNKYLDIIAWLSCGYGVRWLYTMLMGMWVLVLFGIYFSLKGGILKSNMAEKLPRLKEAIFFSLTILLSAPTDWFVHLFGCDKYKTFVRANKYSIFLERIIGLSLVIILINTLSRVMIRY